MFCFGKKLLIKFDSIKKIFSFDEGWAWQYSKLFLKFSNFEPQYSYRLYSYIKKECMKFKITALKWTEADATVYSHFNDWMTFVWSRNKLKIHSFDFL